MTDTCAYLFCLRKKKGFFASFDALVFSRLLRIFPPLLLSTACSEGSNGCWSWNVTFFVCFVVDGCVDLKRGLSLMTVLILKVALLLYSKEEESTLEEALVFSFQFGFLLRRFRMFVSSLDEVSLRLSLL